MRSLFNLENPVWKFVGNIADFFLLTILWCLFSLPIITIGASTTALYYTTLKMASNQEGYLVPSFLNAFKLNLKSGIYIWMILILSFSILSLDCVWSLKQHTTFSLSLLLPFVILMIACIMNLRMIFPLLARCDNTIWNLIRMGFSISLRNFLPVFSTILVSIGIYSIGFFVFWPLLLIAPGLSAYLNSFVFNHILNHYKLALID